MKKITYYLIAIILLIGCQKANRPAGKYYAPANYVLGQEEETRLWTELATLDITQCDETADIVFFYKGKTLPERTLIEEFVIEIHGVQFEKDRHSCTLSGNDIEGVVSYSKVNYDNKKEVGSITKSFDISGHVHSNDPSQSDIIITATYLHHPLTLSIQNLTTSKTKAKFGLSGRSYPTGGETNTKRVFINDSGHDVTISYHTDDYLTKKLEITSGNTGTYTLFDFYESKDSFFILTFDDGRVSKHFVTENRFEYTDLIPEVQDDSYLSFDLGLIEYNTALVCYYTITPEIYSNATLP